MGTAGRRVRRTGQQVVHHLAPAPGEPQGGRLRRGVEAVAARASAAGAPAGRGHRRWRGDPGLQRQRLEAALRSRRVSGVLALACALVARPSVTPHDAGCQEFLAARLERAGFSCESLRYGEVDNLWATHGSGGPVLVLLGHTDVVPPGPREAWASDPFVPEVRDGLLHG